MLTRLPPRDDPRPRLPCADGLSIEHLPSVGPGEPRTPEIAPHVHARLAAHAQGITKPIDAFASALSRAQLRGDALLPLHLPSFGPGEPPEVEALHPAERRLLLIATLSATDRVGVILSAADVGTDIVLGSRVQPWIEVTDGRYRLLDPRLPAALAERIPLEERRVAHSSLARAMRAAEIPFAVWHESLGRDADARLATPLVQLAERCAAVGQMEPATRIAARAATLAADSTLRVRAHRIAARASLWDGRMSDASAWARREGVPSGQGGLAALVDRLLAGPIPEPTPIRNAAELLQEIHPWAITAADREVLDGMLAVIHTFFVDRDEADEKLARLILGARRAPAPWPWSTHQTGVLSPFAEAHLRVLTAAFQARAGAFDDAVRTLRDSGRRLPLGLPGGGVVPSLLRAASDAGAAVPSGLISAWSALGPQRPVVWNDHGALAQTRAGLAQGRPTPAEHGAGLLESLSLREAQVAAAVAEGRTNRAVGAVLGISERTVEVHLRQIFRKFGVSTRSELIATILSRPRGEQVPSASFA